MTLLGKIITTLIWVAISVAVVVTGFIVITNPTFNLAATVVALSLLLALWLGLTFSALIAFFE